MSTRNSFLQYVSRQPNRSEDWRSENQSPIIQGGMGVRVSRADFASAVGNQGCVGVIASVGLGSEGPYG